MDITIRTFDEAFAQLALLQSGRYSDEQAENINVLLADEMGSIEIEIDGPIYHGTVPGELARGIWEFQAEMFRAGAFALYGVADIRKLTAEQRAKLELVFIVKDGSSNLLAEIKDTLQCLEGLFDGMNGVQKTIAIIAVSLIICSFLAFEHHSDNSQVVLLQQEQTAQMKLVMESAHGAAKIVMDRYYGATALGVQSIAKGASDATSIKMGKVNLDAGAIRDLNRKADRIQSTADILVEEFRVFEMRSKDAIKDTCTIAAPDGREFNVTLDHEDVTVDQRRKLWNAAEKRSLIRLEVNITTGSDGAVRKTQLLTVL